MNFLKKIFGTKNERELKRMRPIVARVNELEEQMMKLSDEELRGLTPRFRERLYNGETLDSILPEAFAAVREASRRTTGMRHFDVQIIGGIALHRGMIAEMKTGEGKTLVATLPLYLNALELDPKDRTRGMGVHLVTVNDYLAKRDAEWMGAIYKFLGMTVGVIVHGLSDDERREAYACDITYGTNNEFGFDYLRDNMKFSLRDMVHRTYDFGSEKGQSKIFHYAIVDEVDSILIDEARTPLIISGPAEESTDLYYKVNAIVPFLRRDEDYLVDEKAHSVTLTESGVDKVEKRLGVRNLYDSENTELVHHVLAALKAHTLYKRDIHYVVEDNKVIIVDEFTGRKLPGRRWSEGLHQAIEAKEGLKIENENQTLATITFQNYFRMYKKLAGMTGTADTEAEEFARIYNLDVLCVPTNKPMIRVDHDDVVYKTERAKFMAVLRDIKECYSRGQPVLVGTTSVEKSELVSRLLKKENIPHHVLNAKNHALEAEIIAQAGRKYAVTIATNMAGRGTDIILGGNPEALARAQAGCASGEKYEELLRHFKEICDKEHEEVVKLGGLYVIGTERHESRRIDNQLRGRSGRQGDPGSSRFYLSLEDELMRVFGADHIKRLMDRLDIPEDEPIVHRWMTKAIESAQKRVESRNFEIRKNLLEYDDVMNQQRQSVYGLRKKVMEGSNIHEMVLGAIEQVAYILLDKYCPDGINPEEWDIKGLEKELQSTYRINIDLSGVADDPNNVPEYLVKKMKESYEQKCASIVENLTNLRFPPPIEDVENFDKEAWERDRLKVAELSKSQWNEYVKERYLSTIDSFWKNHLYAMDHLKEGVYLEAYAQKDPKVLYKKEGFELFKQLFDLINQSLVESLFRVEVRGELDVERIKRLRRQVTMHYSRGQNREVSDSQTQNQPRVVGRNDPCPCGSGKKYKKCCLAKHQTTAN